MNPPESSAPEPPDDPSARHPLRPPPIETPGPSVTPPALPESETERAEWADARTPDAEATGSQDPIEELIAEEESAAAAEASMIGGVVPHDGPDAASDPVYQAGGGPQDGWEAAEADLIANATHGDGHGDPLRDAFTPEEESDRAPSVYGEGDRVVSTEVLHDPDGDDGDDPMEGDPNLSADRGPSGSDAA